MLLVCKFRQWQLPEQIKLSWTSLNSSNNNCRVEMDNFFLILTSIRTFFRFRSQGLRKPEVRKLSWLNIVFLFSGKKSRNWVSTFCLTLVRPCILDFWFTCFYTLSSFRRRLVSSLGRTALYSSYNMSWTCSFFAVFRKQGNRRQTNQVGEKEKNI